MEAAIKTIVTTFLSSARGKENLDSKAFQNLVKKNLSGIMEDTNSSSAIKEMQKGLDENSDGKSTLPSLSAPDEQPSTSPLLRMSFPNSENASTLESAMQLMIQTFHKYSGNEGDKYTLSKAELKEMLTTELGNYLGNVQDKEAVEKVMADLDSNNDGEVDFTEFIILVGALTVACNDFFQDYNEKQEKKQQKNK